MNPKLTPREIERRRARAYHAECEMWYVAAAEKIANDKLRSRALENAKYHARHVAHLDAEART